MGMGMGEMWGDMGRYGEMAHLAEDIVLEGGHSGAGDLSGQGVRGEVRSGGRRRRVKWGEKGREGARRGEKGREGARRGEDITPSGHAGGDHLRTQLGPFLF